MHNGKVAAEDILQPPREALLEGCRLHGTVLLVQDSTTLNNTALGASTSGLGALQERCSRAGVGDVRARGGGFHRRRPAGGERAGDMGAAVGRAGGGAREGKPTLVPGVCPRPGTGAAEPAGTVGGGRPRE